METIKISQVNGNESFLKKKVEGKIVEKFVNIKNERCFIVIQDDFSKQVSLRSSKIVIEFTDSWFHLVHQKISNNSKITIQNVNVESSDNVYCDHPYLLTPTDSTVFTIDKEEIKKKNAFISAQKLTESSLNYCNTSTLNEKQPLCGFITDYRIPFLNKDDNLMQSIVVRDEFGDAFLYVFADTEDSFIYPNCVGQVMKIENFIIRPSKEGSKRIILKGQLKYKLYNNDSKKDKRVLEVEKLALDYYTNNSLFNNFARKLENLGSNDFFDVVGRVVRMDGPNIIFTDGTIHPKHGRNITINMITTGLTGEDIRERLNKGEQIYVKIKNLGSKNYVINTTKSTIILVLPESSKDATELKKLEAQEVHPSPQKSNHVINSSPSLVSPIKPVKYLTKINYDMDAMINLADIINHSEKTWKYKTIVNILDYYPKENFYQKVCENCLCNINDKCLKCGGGESKKILCLKFKLKDQSGELYSYLYHKDADLFFGEIKDEVEIKEVLDDLIKDKSQSVLCIKSYLKNEKRIFQIFDTLLHY